MNSNSYLLRFVFSCFLLCGICSCNKAPFYAQYADIDDETWNSRDTLLFGPCEDTVMSAVAYKNVYVCIRNSGKYDYRNLSLGMKVYNGSTEVLADTLNYELYSKTGEKRGDGVMYQGLISSPVPIRIEPHGKYTFKIYHIMRKDPIEGISNVTLYIDD